MLERQGTFQHWKDIWDSKESFQKTNFELYLLKSCMSVFFSNKNYVNWRFLNFKNKKFFLKKFGLKIEGLTLENFLIEKKKIKKNTAFVISCCAFKYQSWLFFFIKYLLKKKIAIKLFKKISRKKKNKIKLKKVNSFVFNSKKKNSFFDFSFNFF